MLSDIKGIGPVTEKRLNELGIYDCETLVSHIPTGYMDMSVIALPQESAEGDFCLFEAKITKISKPFKKGKLEILKAYAECENCRICLVWFNRNYTLKILKTDAFYRIYGKLKTEKNLMTFYNPVFEECGEKVELVGIKPIYRTKGLIPQKTYRGFVSEAMGKCAFESLLTERDERKHGLMSLERAYRTLHFPENMDFYEAKQRVILEKITRRICAFRIAQSKEARAKRRKYSEKVDFKPFFGAMPFPLNQSQSDALEKIKSAFLSDKKMNCVLCGDVGSGKTAVAAAAVYFVVKNGYRAAIMAPTEILARQHYNFLKPIFSELGISVCFLSGSVKNAEKRELIFQIKNGFFDVVIGTHSLLYVEGEIPDLSFVVEDEQHRFGVAQRTGLICKGVGVDVLTLSATPIPRSMMLVAYGEVEYVTISRRFESTVKTAVVPPEKRDGMWKYIAAECEKGTQAYIVAPKIVDAEGAETESVEGLAEELKKYFPQGKTAVLHGKMKACDKQAALDSFAANAVSALVSTTVVEVGIDVPNASIIAIMDADRFGLAALHQLRGRVGRNGQPAYCFLYTAKTPTEGLRAMCECSDGFALAEKDFETRGGGDIFGLEQSGGGTIEGLTPSNLKKAKELALSVDYAKAETMLEEEINLFCLRDVSLT